MLGGISFWTFLSSNELNKYNACWSLLFLNRIVVFPFGISQKKSAPRTSIAHKGWHTRYTSYTDLSYTQQPWELITELWREFHDSVPSVSSCVGKHTEVGEGSEGVGALMY